VPKNSELPTPRTNRLLASLPAADCERLLPHLKPVDLPMGEVLYPFNESVRYVHFPTSGIVSLVLDSVEGTSVEVGMTGHEGIVGVAALLSNGPATTRAIVQVAGKSWRMPASVLRDELKQGGVLLHFLHQYLNFMMVQAAQTALCNRIHMVDQRLSRWLLMVRDRVHSNDLTLTHEFIADMLGVRRAGVTEALGELREAGMIDTSRGLVTILDPAALEGRACECYSVVRDRFNELFNNSGNIER
jgi:CRP-like cAMP-binding protein